jgi:uncharacterized membrane protein YsdA (DUF1294 family)
VNDEGTAYLVQESIILVWDTFDGSTVGEVSETLSNIAGKPADELREPVDEIARPQGGRPPGPRQGRAGQESHGTTEGAVRSTRGKRASGLKSASRFSIVLDSVLKAQLFALLGDWLLLSGFGGFVAMGLDKARAVDHAWRIPEKTLFMVALGGGSFGIVVGSWVFRHKTSKSSFLVVVYLLTLAWIFVLDRTGFLGWLASLVPEL